MRNFEEIKSTRNIIIKGESGNNAFGGSYYDSVSGKWLNFIFSKQIGWEHLSVSTPSKTPTWDQMCRMKEIFWKDEETCLEYHPAKSQYVNMHQHCLHIWRPVIDEDFLNEPESQEQFPVPPHFLVGFRDEEEKKQFLELAKVFNVRINEFQIRGESNE